MVTENRKKIAVKSTVKAIVGINLPDIHLKREWLKKGATVFIFEDDLEQAMFDPGVEYLFKSGLLYIDDMPTKIKLGLEPENAQVPTNIIVLSDEQKKRYLTVTPFHEFKEITNKMSHDQLIDFANYAVELEITDIPRCDLLKKLTEIDVMKTVMTNRETARLEKGQA